MDAKRAVFLTILFLIIANIPPLIGVILFNWNISNIILLYWLETGIVGFYSVTKAILCRGDYADKIKVNVNKKTHFISYKLNKIIMALFFIVGYFVYLFATSIIVSFLAGITASPSGYLFMLLISGKILSMSIFQQIETTLISLFASHSISFFIYFIVNKEFEKALPFEQMGYFKERAMVIVYTFLLAMAILIVLGSLVALGVIIQTSPLFPYFYMVPVIALVLVKICLDIKSHIKVHSN